MSSEYSLDGRFGFSKNEHREQYETARTPLSSLQENLVSKRSAPGLREFTETVLGGKGIFRTKANWLDSENLKTSDNINSCHENHDIDIFSKSKKAAVDAMSRPGFTLTANTKTIRALSKGSSIAQNPPAHNNIKQVMSL